MKFNELYILFVLDKKNINKKGIAPLRCRLTYLGKRKIFSVGLFINPDYWDSKFQKAVPDTGENNQFNIKISLIKQKINQAFLFLQVREETTSVEEIYLKYIGNPTKNDIGIIQYFNYFLDEFKEQIGIDIKEVTWKKFEFVKNDLTAFIKYKYNKNDMLLNTLNLPFIQAFETYLKAVKGKKQVTVNKNIQRFKKVVRSAVNEGKLDAFPFAEHKPKKVENTVVFLDDEELKLLENHQFTQNRLAKVRDLFVFCCYTGLPYLEMSSLEHRHIHKGFDKNLWISMTRTKTMREFSIPLLPKALEILNSYSNPSKQKIFPEISNQRFNSYLKEIADIVGIDKNLTHHVARKTFATTILLYNDIPMEIVSELLGHSSIKITQEHYAKVVKKKVSEHINSLKNRLK